jgi:hypothetical protein
MHPAQHAMDSIIPATGTDSGNALLYFANDGGIYRALNGFLGLNTGSCSGANQFDDLNQNLGSMAQFVSLSQHPTDANTLFGGVQGNGFPATNQATTNSSWVNALGGDGANNAIDPTAPMNWYASNPDVPPAGLGIQLCSNGVSCNDGLFDIVVGSDAVGGDDGGFIVPFILDPHSSSAMVVGTCRVWRGPRSGGAFVALSPNFDTLDSGTCSGSEVNQVRALATAGLTDSNGSSVIYATTNGFGPIDGPMSTPPGGRVWVTTSATTGIPAFADVTNNGPVGNINPNQFPISGVATDSSDASGNTAYITVMGFTGGTGHVWKTTNAGATWFDFTANLPDSPVNAVVVYPPMSQVYVATDVGVFGSSTSTPSWTELGPNPSTNQFGFLPNVAVTALGIFASGGQQLLRAATYGRGIWQFNLVITPDFQLSIPNPTATVFGTQTATFSGTASALSGYANSISLSCIRGTTAPPSTCNPSPASLTPASKTPFTLTAGGVAGDYSFNVQAAGSDSKHVTHSIPVTLHVVNFGLTTPSPSAQNVGRGATSSPVSFQVTATGSFSQSVTVACTTTIPNAICTLTPGNTVNPTSSAPVAMTVSVAVPDGTALGNYAVTLQASTSGAPSPLSTSFTLNVISNPDFILSAPSAFPEVIVGSTGTSGSISIASQDGFSDAVQLSCPSTYGAGSCSITPATVGSYPATATLTINGTTFVAGSYSLSIKGTSGSVVHTLPISFNVGDFSISGPPSVTAVPGAQATMTVKLISSYSYAGSVNASCDATALAGATCSLAPANPISVASGAAISATASINIPSNSAPGIYDMKVSAQDTNGFPSHSLSVPLTIAQDFLVKSSTPSQTVTAGQTSGPYNLTVLPVGTSFTGAVTLACTAGLPPQAQCSFSPSTPITPGSSAVDVVMSISTKGGSSVKSRAAGVWFFSMISVLLPGIVFLRGGYDKVNLKFAVRSSAMIASFLLLILLLSCSGVSNGGNGGGGGTKSSAPTTYQVTITGTSPGTAPDAGQSTVVLLIVD